MSITHRPDIVEYYDNTWLDYRAIWLNSKNLAMHFGYWDEGTESHSDSLLNMNRELAAMLDMQPGMRILDAGCGVGGSSLWLAENFEAQVVGITLSADQVRRARRFAEERDLADRVTFEVADYCDTGFDPGAFDMVWAEESCCYAEDKAAFLAESYRILRSGGQLGVADGFRGSRNMSRDNELLFQRLVNSWAADDICTIIEFAEMAESAGFFDVGTRDISSNVYRSIQRLSSAATLWQPLGWMLTKLGVRPSVTYDNVVGAKLVGRAFRRHLLSYAMITARRP
ncbi:SAM-dependent methyltransferase [Nocardia testacea]|uniref:SAM-dependent methyltransferase n=1 Tax=Nocardia testacea TaxID=248551 RepID=UPI003A86F2E4